MAVVAGMSSPSPESLGARPALGGVTPPPRARVFKSPVGSNPPPRARRDSQRLGGGFDTAATPATFSKTPAICGGAYFRRLTTRGQKTRHCRHDRNVFKDSTLWGSIFLKTHCCQKKPHAKLPEYSPLATSLSISMPFPFSRSPRRCSTLTRNQWAGKRPTLQ